MYATVRLCKYVDEKHAEVTGIFDYIRVLSFSFMHPKISFMLCAIATNYRLDTRYSNFFTKGQNGRETYLTLKSSLQITQLSVPQVFLIIKNKINVVSSLPCLFFFWRFTRRVKRGVEKMCLYTATVE